MSQRERRESEVGVFGTAPTVLTKPDHIRELLEQMQGDPAGAGDRATREMDPEVFRALIHENLVAEPNTAAADADVDLAIPVAPEEPVQRGELVQAAHAEVTTAPSPTPPDTAVESSRPQLPVAPAPAVAWQTWVLLLIVVFVVTLALLHAFGR